MSNIRQFIIVLCICAAAGYGIMAVADYAIAVQDLICQEGC